MVCTRPSASTARATQGIGSLRFGRGDGGCAGATLTMPTRCGCCSSRQRRNRSWARRLSGCCDGIGRAMGDDGLDHRRERLDRRDVAVDQPERLAVVGADPDLEEHAIDRDGEQRAGRCRPARRCGRWSARRRRGTPRAVHLADDHPVLDVRRGACALDHVGQGEVVGSRQESVRQGLRHCRQQRPLVREPDRDGERNRAARRASRPVWDSAIRSSEVAPWRIAHASAPPSDRDGITVDQDPCGTVDDERGAVRETARRRRRNVRPRCSATSARSLIPSSRRRARTFRSRPDATELCIGVTHRDVNRVVET